MPGRARRGSQSGRRTGSLVVLLLVGLGGCGDTADVERPDPPDTTAAPEESALTSTPRPGGGTGVAISRSDVGGVPDTPLASGEVLVFTGDRAGDVAAAAGLGPDAAGSLQHVAFQLDPGQVAELVGAVAPIGPDGRFSLPAGTVPGSHLVCLADTFADHEAGPPYEVVGCALVDLPDGAALTVAFGEGGVEASLD